MKFYYSIFFFAIIAVGICAPIVDRENDGHEDSPGVLTQTETPEESFSRSDMDGDSNLSFDEFLHTELSYVQLKKGEFDMLDTNADGTLSHDEYSTFYGQQKKDSDDGQKKYYIGLFKDFDANQDKRLNQSEVKKILSKRFLLQPKDNFVELFNRYDTDSDGGLDQEEYQHFDKTFPFYELEPMQVLV